MEGGAEALLTKPIDFVALRSEIDGRVTSGVALRRAFMSARVNLWFGLPTTSASLIGRLRSRTFKF